MANPIPPIQPAPIRAAPLDAQGLPSKIWVNWFNQIQRTSQVVATNTGGVAGLTSQVAALLSDVTGIDATLATHTTELAALFTDVTGIDATLLAQAASILAAALFATALPPDRQYLPELEELKQSLAALAFERQYSPELEDLKASLAPLPSDRPYSTELEELKAYVQVCASGFVDRFVEELTDLRALVASFDVDAGSLANAVSAGVLSTSLQIAANLSDLANAATARTNLGLGAAALLATPVPIASGGTGAATFLAAGLPTLAATNTFSGGMTVNNAFAVGTTGTAIVVSGNNANVNPIAVELVPTFSGASGGSAYTVLAEPTISGVATNAFVFVALPILAASAALTLLQQMNVSSPILGSGATIGTATGVQIAAQKVTGVTTGIGVNQVGASDTNTFAGATSFGTGITLTGGSVSVSAAGNGLKIKEGSNARSGTGTLVAGTVTIANTSITTNTRVQVTGNGGGVAANFGALYRSAIVAGTSFTVKSTNALDTATFDWLLIEAL